MAKTGQMNLSSLEKALLGIPFLGGVFFGLFPFLAPALFASVFGFSGNDEYIYRLAGAATFGYAVVLFDAISGQATWNQMKYFVLATFVFNTLSIYACLRAILTPGEAVPVVYAIFVTSILILLITGSLLKKYGLNISGNKDIPGWLPVILILASISAGLFGILPLFPKLFASVFNYLGTDAFIYRQAGAACFGYAVMGIYELRSKNYDEIKLPLLMGAVFNGLGLIASIIEISTGRITPLVLIVTAATLVFTPGLFWAYRQK